jgi:hypothetical protein
MIPAPLVCIVVFCWFWFLGIHYLTNKDNLKERFGWEWYALRGLVPCLLFLWLCCSYSAQRVVVSVTRQKIHPIVEQGKLFYVIVQNDQVINVPQKLGYIPADPDHMTILITTWQDSYYGLSWFFPQTYSP